MALHGGTPYPLALAEMGLSDAHDFFSSKSFSSWRSMQEARQKVTSATLSRMDNLMKGINALGKLLSGRRR